MTTQDELKRLTCVFCKFFYFFPGCPGYSELTPGYNAQIGCSTGRWELDLYRDYEGDYRRKLLFAETCEDFVAQEGLL